MPLDPKKFLQKQWLEGDRRRWGAGKIVER